MEVLELELQVLRYCMQSVIEMMNCDAFDICTVLRKITTVLLYCFFYLRLLKCVFESSQYLVYNSPSLLRRQLLTLGFLCHANHSGLPVADQQFGEGGRAHSSPVHMTKETQQGCLRRWLQQSLA